MIENLRTNLLEFYENIIVSYFSSLYESPLKIIIFIIDISLVIFLIVKAIQVMKGTRAWQLMKGIAFLILATILSSVLGFKILNNILTYLMSYGVIVLIIVFQPELRRALEQLGTSKLTKFFGIDKNIAVKTKENIYKVVIAAVELAKEKTGGLIVIERDIKIKDIINTGIELDAEISPQLIVNIFTPKTPLHDGAIIISENKIVAAACMLPLANDSDIAKELGTRHRAAIGISKESDAVAVVISEETGKISVARDGTLIADVSEEALKKILIKNVVTKRFGPELKENAEKAKKIKFGNKKTNKNPIGEKNEEHKTNN